MPTIKNESKEGNDIIDIILNNNGIRCYRDTDEIKSVYVIGLDYFGRLNIYTVKSLEYIYKSQEITYVTLIDVEDNYYHVDLSELKEYYNNKKLSPKIRKKKSVRKKRRKSY